jgi:hypothetical protein
MGGRDGWSSDKTSRRIVEFSGRISLACEQARKLGGASTWQRHICPKQVWAVRKVGLRFVSL